MTWTVYSIGDSAYLAEVMNAAAMITGDGSFMSAARVALLSAVVIAVMAELLKGTSNTGFAQIFGSWLVFTLMFSAGAKVVIIDSYDGSARTVSRVPVGIAAAGGIISGIGYTLTRKFETAFSVPSMTGYGFLMPLGTLARARGILRDGASPEFRSSLRNYLMECTLTGVDLGSSSPQGIMNGTSPLNAVKFSSGVYGTKVFGLNMTCTEAYDELSARAGTSELASLRAKIAKMSGTTPDRAEAELRRALDGLGLAGVSVRDFMLGAVLLPAYRNAVKGKYVNDLAFASAILQGQAEIERNTEMAAEASLFATLVRPMMTFFEGFVYAVSPLAGITMLLGAAGIRTAGRILLVLLWITLWMPLLSIVNLYVMMSAAGDMEALGATGEGLPSFTGIGRFDSMAAHYLAVGGMLAAAVPAAALMLVYGTAVSASGMVSRMQGRDVIDEKSVSPDVASASPAVASAPGYQTSSTKGTSVQGAEGLVRSFSLGSAFSSMQSKSRDALNAESESFSDTLAKASADVWSRGSARTNAVTIGRQVMEGESSSSAFVRSKARQIGENYGLSASETQTVAGALQGMLSGGAGPKSGLAASLSSMFSGSSSNAQQDQKSSSRQDLVGSIMSAGLSKSNQSEFRKVLQKDFTEGRTDTATRTLSESSTRALSRSSSRIRTLSERVSEGESLSRSIAPALSMDGITLSRTIASSDGAMRSLEGYLDTRPDLRSAAEEKEAFTSSVVADDRQARALAIMETLSADRKDPESSLRAAARAAGAALGEKRK